MAVFNKFNQFTKNLLDGKFNFSTDTVKVFLADTAPTAADTLKADIAEIAPGFGYSAGGLTVSITESLTGGLTKISGSAVTFTASGGTVGPFRYAVLYNSSGAGEPLICWWDYGSSVTLQDTEIFTINFDTVNGIFDLQ